MAQQWLSRVMWTVTILFILGQTFANSASPEELDVIKKIILEKLGLGSEPHASLTDIPRSVIDQLDTKHLMSDDKDVSVITKILPESSEKGKLAFKINEFLNKKIVSAKLNLFFDKKATGPVLITRNGKTIAKFNVIQPQWNAKVVTKDLMKWLDKRSSPNNKNYVLRMTGTTLPVADRTHLHVEYTPNKRKKRDSKCEENNDGCCMKFRDLTTKELKWDSWFHSPKRFRYNYCSGKCNSTKTSLYGKLVSMLDKNSSGGCCVPTRLRGLRVMYMSKDKTLFDKEIENFMAEDCKCTGS